LHNFNGFGGMQLKIQTNLRETKTEERLPQISWIPSCLSE
jgi:hypothetical protein